ncbi:MAG: cytochrome c [Nitrospirae bacterium]|nr:cytochrome c [Nitrospirota bacterium]
MKNIFSMCAIILLAFSVAACTKQKQEVSGQKAAPAADEKSIEAGKALFVEKCKTCHDAYSTREIVGPGLLGILKNPVLPESGKPATPENIKNQIKHPSKDMPPFPDLTDDQIDDIVAFLSTL